MKDKLPDILRKYWLPIVLWAIALIWFTSFSVQIPERWITPQLPKEEAYFLASVVGYLIIRRLKIRRIEVGWGIITTGFLIDLLSEFTGEPEIITNLIGIIMVAGLIFMARGFYQFVLFQKKQQDIIRAERDLLQTLIDNIPDYIYFKDMKNRFVRVNKARARIAGTTPEKMIGKTNFDFFPHEEAKRTFADDDYVKKTGKPIVDKIEELTLIDGKKHWVSVTKIPWYDHEGKIRGTIGVSRDITERRMMEEKLREAEKTFRILTENCPVGIYLFQDNVFKYVNPAFARIFGYNIHELVGKKGPRDLTYPDDWSIVEKNIKDRLTGKADFVHYTFRGMRREGEIFDAEVFGSRVIHQGRPAIMGTLLDITERKKYEKMLQELARKDHLTGLFNDRYFYEKMKEQLNRFKRYKEIFSLLYIDIDGFKSCNDKYGHLEGDRILKHIGKVLKDSLRKMDSAYRVGGEEFVIMLPHTSKEEAKNVAERIREVVHQLFYHKYQITVSIGVADSTSDNILQEADQAMYRAKKNGKNRVWVAH